MKKPEHIFFVNQNSNSKYKKEQFPMALKPRYLHNWLTLKFFFDADCSYVALDYLHSLSSSRLVDAIRS